MAESPGRIHYLQKSKVISLRPIEVEAAHQSPVSPTCAEPRRSDALSDLHVITLPQYWSHHGLTTLDDPATQFCGLCDRRCK